MTTTATRVERAARDLADGKIPDRDDLAAMTAAWQRIANGLPYSQATGQSGSLAKKERDAAIVRLANNLTGSVWDKAEQVRRILQRAPTSDDARDAIELGGDGLKRNMVYSILTAATKDQSVKNPVIPNEQDDDDVAGSPGAFRENRQDRVSAGG